MCYCYISTISTINTIILHYFTQPRARAPGTGSTVHDCLCIYIYIYREREREICVYLVYYVLLLYCHIINSHSIMLHYSTQPRARVPGTGSTVHETVSCIACHVLLLYRCMFSLQYIYIYMCMCMCMCMCICICICMYVCMYVCIYVCMYV